MGRISSSLKGTNQRRVELARAKWRLVKSVNEYEAMRTIEYADKLAKAVRRYITAEIRAA